MIDQHLGARLAMAREHLGLTVGDVASRVDVSGQCLTQIERGEVRIAAVLIARLARVLDVSPRWLYQGLPGQDAFDRAG